ncbi:putative mRNA 3'-end processing protein [Thermochaetoides thermophila DSM 1495]|uniref:mRNA 3'-end-processing protein n=1 Tax=Chaetomium thermophilum (strain DSM 1495 / CBS 144.50 / IMI 039719) TaxID=759272 RepID=G0SD77_CHATD|nr:putative mRNA 3'-end processing protein [Thermochaetoides thermophila DSM 1495]EGS19297.1 putative mRNA 3'-end processing protein [Thermochaetoides thermophila DSM 1495]
MATTTSPPPTGPNPMAAHLLARTHPTYTFTFTPFLQKTYQHSLPADRPVCKAYQTGSCPLKSHCPERHTLLPSTANANNGKDPQTGTGGGGGGFGSLVCKHWLRALCKKGETCEFLHEYNLRKMPECNFFVRNGYCSNGDECLYLHIDPSSRVPPCPAYERGFCPAGPKCDKKHVKRKMCPYYLAGFCPEGKACKEGAHPKWVGDKELEKLMGKEEKKDNAGTEGQQQQGQVSGQQDEKEKEKEREAREREERERTERGEGEGAA